jgi:nuclear pore complex protein Nup155
LESRYEYLRDAVLQAKSAGIEADSSRKPIDSSTVDLLEGKLTVLRFQMQIKQELELMTARVENISSSSESPSGLFPRDNILADAEAAKAAKDKAKELSLNLKSITQLYNDYAVPFELWEVCLFFVHSFAVSQ